MRVAVIDAQFEDERGDDSWCATCTDERSRERRISGVSANKCYRWAGDLHPRIGDGVCVNIEARLAVQDYVGAFGDRLVFAGIGHGRVIYVNDGNADRVRRTLSVGGHGQPES